MSSATTITPKNGSKNTTNPLTLGIGTPYYSDSQCMARMLNSMLKTIHVQNIPDWFHIKFLLIDGRYEGFGNPSDPVHSDDESDDVIQQLKNRMTRNTHKDRLSLIHFKEQKPVIEIEKRNHLLEQAAKTGCDFLLIVDTDEWFDDEEIAWIYFAEQLRIIRDKSRFHGNLFNIWMYDTYQKYACWRPRLIFKPGDMQYMTTHYQLMRKGTDPNDPENRSGTTVGNISQKILILRHDNGQEFREEARMLVQKKYEMKLPKIEKEYVVKTRGRQ